MTGEQSAGVFYAGAALVGGFEEVAHLAGDVADDGHDQKMRERDANPEAESVGDEERAEHAADGTFPGFFRRDVRSEGMFADGTADEIGGGVCGPGDDEGEEEKTGAQETDAIERHGEGEWEGNKEEGARTNADGWNGLHQFAARPKSQSGETQEKNK